MPGRQRVGNGVQAHPHRVVLPRLERQRMLVTLAVGQVEQAARDKQRGAGRGDVTEAHG